MEPEYEAFQGKTKDEVLEFLKLWGRPDNMQDRQNSSPTMHDFLHLDGFGEEIKYQGYIIRKPRDDYRVSIDGCDIYGISADEILILQKRFTDADEFDWEKNQDDTYNLHMWWD